MGAGAGSGAIGAGAEPGGRCLPAGAGHDRSGGRLGDLHVQATRELGFEFNDVWGLKFERPFALWPHRAVEVKKEAGRKELDLQSSAARAAAGDNDWYQNGGEQTT